MKYLKPVLEVNVSCLYDLFSLAVQVVMRI